MSMRSLLLGILLLIGLARADDYYWPGHHGAGDLLWGTGNQPLEAIPRNRNFHLPDAGYIGARPGDRPDDIEITGPFPNGERRFLRYVNGALVDAWLVREGPIDVSPFEIAGEVQWRGMVLGPGEDGFRAIGDAVSWKIGDRTVLHWKDRMSDREILASRAIETGQYQAVRPAPLEPRGGGNHSMRMRGTLKPYAKAVKDRISGCFNAAPKPVEATVALVYDRLGRPGRIRVDTDQPSLEVEECVAGALSRTGAPPRFEGQLDLFRMR